MVVESQDEMVDRMNLKFWMEVGRFEKDFMRMDVRQS
jgi:hypothetical protein